MLTQKTKVEKLLVKFDEIFDFNRRFALSGLIFLDFNAHMGNLG